MSPHVQGEVLNTREMSECTGVKVSNTPGTVVPATTDVGIFLLIGAIRNFNRAIFELRRGC
jgi:glyoxylate reductase